MITRSRVVKSVLLYALLICGAMLMVFPFAWMLLSALKSSGEIAQIPPTFWPEQPTIANFFAVFEIVPFARYLFNSVVIAVISVIVAQFTSILAAFGFSVLRFRGSDIVFAVLVATMVVPFELLIITNYSTISGLKLIDTIPALVLPFLVSIFYTFIIRNTFRSIPEGVYWSARIDGAGNWRYLWTVLVPMSRSTIVTTSLLNVIASWNAFLWPLLVVNSQENRTLPLGLFAFITDAGVRYELLMAASTLAVLPMLLLFAFASSQIIQGVARGGLKG